MKLFPVFAFFNPLSYFFFPPYLHSYIPHPMIVSQVFALLGLYKAAHYRAEWPYVVPVHVLLYVTHMLQEHFDIYRRLETKWTVL